MLFEQIIDQRISLPLPKKEEEILQALHDDWIFARTWILDGVGIDKRVVKLANVRASRLRKKEAFWLKALQFNPYVIWCIKRPTDRLMVAAVTIDPHTIKFIKEPCTEAIEQAVMRDGWLIKCVKQPSEELCLLAIRNKPHAILCMKSVTYNIYKEALRYGYDASFHVLYNAKSLFGPSLKNPHFMAIYKEAVSRNYRHHYAIREPPAHLKDISLSFS